MRILAMAAAAAMTTGSAHAASLDDVFGIWLIESNAAIVEIVPCGDMACGNIVWLAEPVREDGSAKLDRTNPDPALQSRPICGLPLIGNFRRDGDEWNDGFIYNPEDGKTYTSKMHVKDDGTLYVRGYVGIPLLGQSQIWTRRQDNNGGC